MSRDRQWDGLVFAGIDHETNYSPFEKMDEIGVFYIKEIGRIPLLTDVRERESKAAGMFGREG